MKGNGFTVAELLIVIGVVALLLLVLVPALDRVRSISPRMVCGTNLSSLGKAAWSYASDNDEQYPAAERWCDLLLDYAGERENMFKCYGAQKAGDKGRSHYAMNSAVTPSDSPELVVLFDAKGGWNQHGGQELLSPENHMGDGCSVLFNDAQVRFEKEPNLEGLNWIPEIAEDVNTGPATEKAEKADSWM